MSNTALISGNNPIIANQKNTTYEPKEKISFFGCLLNSFIFMASFGTSNRKDNTNIFNNGNANNTTSVNTQNSSPKRSLAERIKSFFFGSSKTEGLAEQNSDGNCISLETGGEQVYIKKQGNTVITDETTLGRISEDLQKTNGLYDKDKTDYLASFDKDSRRGFNHSLKNENNEVIKNDWDVNLRVATAQNEHQLEEKKLEQANYVIDEVTKAIFPENKQGDTKKECRVKLAENLKGIAHQGLFASPINAFSQHPPSDGTCLVQGAASHADFSYSITGEKKITIQATGTFNNSNNNTMLATHSNGDGKNELTPLAFPKNNENESIGSITGEVSLTIIATIGDDGTITTLNCTSLETSWECKLNKAN